MHFDEDMYNENERNKSLDQVFNELKDDKVRQERESSIRLIIENSRTKLEEYNEGIKLEQTKLYDCRIDFKSGIEQELERIRNSEQKNGIDVLTSCLSVVTMALITCRDKLPYEAGKCYLFVNKQLVNYCLLVSSKMEDTDSSTNEEGGLLEILAMEGCSVVTAMVAATYALLGRTVDVVTNSRFENFHKWRSFYTTLNLRASCNVDEISEGGVRLKQSILYCCNEDKWETSDNDAYAEEEDKSLDQILKEMKEEEVGHVGEIWIKTIINNSIRQRDKYKHKYKYRYIYDFESGIDQELERIQNPDQKDGVDVLSSCLSVVSMALYICKGYWPLNTQLVSYCLLVAGKEGDERRSSNEKGRLLEILTGEGKSCVIAMAAATYALQGGTVDIVTSSPVLSQRDAEEWREFYFSLKLKVGCNIEYNTKNGATCYECPIVYGTVETFARDILKTEFLLQDVRKGRKCDIVIVDEVDSMLIDQGGQCTYLSHDIASIGMRHFEPIFSLIWMNVNTLWNCQDDDDVVWYGTEPEVFLATLSRIRKDIDPLLILRLAEDDEKSGIRKGFTDEYISEDIGGQKQLLSTLNASRLVKFFAFALKNLDFDFNIMKGLSLHKLPSGRIRLHRTRDEDIDIVVYRNGLSSILFKEDQMKFRSMELVTYAISDENETRIDLPVYFKEYCNKRLRYWIDNAFFAKNMQLKREYIIQDDAIYPVDYKSTGVIETNKKWGDGLQQFLEMKHGLPRSPLPLITNFLSNINFFDRYGSNILGVSGTLGNDPEKQLMRDTFLVEFATIPTSKTRKLFEVDSMILENEYIWLNVAAREVESAVANQRAVLVINEDIATADKIHEKILSRGNKAILDLHTKGDIRVNKELKAGNIVITTNLGARGTDFFTDDDVNKNGGLFVLVTFIPLNDRVEKQAFGRTGRRGAAGSCQIIVNRETMPEWSRKFETVDEVKRLRDSIEIHRLNDMAEVNLMRNKESLFQKYCELKKKFVTTSKSEPDDIEIQLELLDETWAKWIQDVETRTQGVNHPDLMEELRQKIKDCSDRAKQYTSVNIYHIFEFGEIRLLNYDYAGASKFYDQVVRMDPAWSAFAHYNRAYCTIQMKSDGYIRRAIDDLNGALCKLEIIKEQHLLSFLSNNESKQYDTSKSNMTDAVNRSRATLYYIMMECQFLHHIDTHIVETIEKLEAIDAMKGVVTTVRRNILKLIIPGADGWTEQMLEKYRELGLHFIFNIDEKSTCFFTNQNITRLAELLHYVAVEMFQAFSRGILLKGCSLELKNTIDAVCNIEAVMDVSLACMSRGVSKVIMTGIHSIDFIRDVSSLFPMKQTEQESGSETTTGTSQFEQFTSKQASLVFELLAPTIQRMKNWISSRKDDRLVYMTNVAMGVLGKQIQEIINNGQKLHQALCYLLYSVTAKQGFDHSHVVNCISDLVQRLVNSPRLDDIQTIKLENLAVDLLHNSRHITMEKTRIKAAAENIDIKSVITVFSDMLDNLNISTIEPRTSVDPIVCDDVEMLETANKVLSSACSDAIRLLVESRIEKSLVYDSHQKTARCLYSPINEKLMATGAINQRLTRRTTRKKAPSSDASRRLTEIYFDLKKRDLHARFIAGARLISECQKFTITIVDVDGEAIKQIHSPEKCKSIEIEYVPPCPTYPTGHYDAYSVDRKKYDRYGETYKEVNKYYRRLCSRDHPELFLTLNIFNNNSSSTITNHIRAHPRRFGELLASEHYASQMKRGCALLRLDMNHPTRQTNPCEYVELDSSQHFSCIDQALECEIVGQLAKVLAEYESESRSADANSSVSRDACKLFVSSGNSFEAGVYRQLIVERINDGDITTALKLCCIGHQTLFCRYISNLPISDGQTVRDTFEQMLKTESYEQERSIFLSICDEWYRFLEPQGLMNIKQRELLREWISTRQYANTEDPIVSQVLEKLSNVKVNKIKRGNKRVETKKPRSGKGRKKRNNKKTQVETL